MPKVQEIPVETALEMLKVDFEQAFEIHNQYKDAERDLFKFSLKVLAFPLLVIAALISARIFSSYNATIDLLDWPPLWVVTLLAGCLNIIVVRSYVVTDKVQTESKYQVNALRSLYLTSLAETFPDGWSPVWGSTNPYLATKIKLKAASLTSTMLSLMNAAYIGYSVDRLFLQPWSRVHVLVALAVGLAIFLLQMEFTWSLIRRLKK